MKSTTPCKVCGQPEFRTSYSGPEKILMAETGVCFNCAFWELRARAGVDAVIDNFVYAIGTEPRNEDDHYSKRQSGSLGMSGRRFDIEFFDGRRITTHNLWAGGLVPEPFRARLPNTARFLNGAERAEVGDMTCWNPVNTKTLPYPAYRK